MNAFRNFVQGRGEANETPQAQQCLRFLPKGAFKEERHQFVKDFYASCGTKGDMDGFIEQALISRATHASGQKDGWRTPGMIAKALGLQREDFPSPG
eukprot:6492196-Amphidinium_carterae.1